LETHSGNRRRRQRVRTAFRDRPAMSARRRRHPVFSRVKLTQL
jgi:hypothetical protein